MIPELIASEILTIWVAKGGLEKRNRTANLQELAATFARAMKAAVAEENEECADIASGCHARAIAAAIRLRVAK